MTAFLPWVRTGLIGAVTTADPLDGELPPRATFTVGTTVNQGPSGSLPIRVHGPGDVLSLDRRLVVRTEPADGAAEAEPNYFCSVEFSRPDLPWLLTPAAPNGDRLRPWIVLVVVAADAGELEVGDGSRLPVLHVQDVRAELPDLRQAHAWAHAQAAAPADLTAGAAAATPPLSRLVCPRLLRSRTRYVAAVVPAFEPGRLAGLGLPVPESATTAPAWDATVAGARDLPVYFSWQFATGAEGDFEVLVSRLRRTPLGGATAAGRPAVVAGLPGGLPDLAGWRFPGALGTCPDPLPGSDFVTGMTELVHGTRTAEGVPVPPPLYGRWHAAATSLGATDKPWLRRLNVDPRYRSAAALGTRLVQEHQEALMAAAWQQIGQVEAANALLRQAQLARTAGAVLYDQLAGLDAAALLQVCRPLHTRVLDPSAQTLATHVSTSRVPAAMTSAAFRRMLRPRGPLGRRAGVTAPELLRRVNDGTPVVPPRPPPDGMVTVDAGRGPEVPRWCEITPAQLRDRLGSPVPPVTRAQWDALIDAAMTQQRDMPPCPPAEPPPPRRPRIPLDEIKQVLVDATRPEDTIRARVRARVTAPPGWAPSDPLAPILAAPRIDTPVARDLIALSPDLLLPGIADLPAESVAAAPTNTRFVESLMVGVNHEFGRELLWRGYPTDQRGTSLRRFWDRSASLAGPGDDLPAIDHTWGGELGTHLLGGTSQVVLVVRGELLRRYPRTTIYAARARWVDGRRQPVEPAAGADPAAPEFPERYPAFGGTIAPDVSFVGFDLPDDPRGDRDPAAGRPGWFFVFQQPRTEARFGLDATVADPPVGGAADLSWPAVGKTPSGHVDLTVALTGVTLPGWGREASSAQLAAWCEQRPFRVCIHASDLLPLQEVTP